MKLLINKMFVCAAATVVLAGCSSSSPADCMRDVDAYIARQIAMLEKQMNEAQEEWSKDNPYKGDDFQELLNRIGRSAQVKLPYEAKIESLKRSHPLRLKACGNS